jgi:HAE1 family hydrophobic/amphiphilic exporter-1
VKEHRVDIGTLARRLQNASSNMVLGQVSDGGLRYTARAVGAFSSVESIGELPVDGRGLLLRDIAEITYEEPPIAYGRHLDRKYAVALTVYKESTANTVETANAVMRVINEDIAADPLLQGIRLFMWENQAQMITDGIDGLKTSGLVGGLLAVLVLYLFLRRLDSTSIVSLSIPFSVLAACAVLYFMGKNLNILSMMGLMLGVGMLVDNAIVVLESIDRTHRDERDTQRAALHGASRVAMAVTASTATSLIVFRAHRLVGRGGDRHLAVPHLLAVLGAHPHPSRIRPLPQGEAHAAGGVGYVARGALRPPAGLDASPTEGGRRDGARRADLRLRPVHARHHRNRHVLGQQE